MVAVFEVSSMICFGFRICMARSSSETFFRY